LVEGVSLSPAITARGFEWHRIAILLLLGVIVTALVVWRIRPVRTSVGIRSVAVLPLENISADASQDYFADGMTDQLITNLGQIHSLRVISRTSAMQYRGVHKPLPQVARELQVEAIIEGTVLRSGDKVRITAQLIQAREDRHLWAQSFEGDLKDVLVLQENVARAIASQVQMTLVPGVHIRAGIERPLNMEAYESYLKGEYYLNRFTAESFQQALENFQQAVEKDPRYAPAYAKMAACYRMLANMGVLSKPEANEKAKALEAKALEMDPNLGAVHAVKGWGLLLYDLDFASAGDEFRRAVELSPNSVEGHQGLGDYYAAVGRLQEAVQEVERARELDPLASIVNHDLCQTLTFARRWDEALAQCKANLELDPNSARTIWVIGDIYTARGMESEALSYLLRGLKAVGAAPKMMAAAEAGAGRGGLKGCWQALIPFALDGVRNGGLDAFNVAVAYTRAGDPDDALLWLQKAVEARSFGIAFLGVDPTFDPLRSDPRFRSLLRDLSVMKHFHPN
jgi:TolB-like protein/Tfp pilus assembly protein PilF